MDDALKIYDAAMARLPRMNFADRLYSDFASQCFDSYLHAPKYGHGLPVEYEIDKALNIGGKEDVPPRVTRRPCVPRRGHRRRGSDQ